MRPSSSRNLARRINQARESGARILLAKVIEYDTSDSKASIEIGGVTYTGVITFRDVHPVRNQGAWVVELGPGQWGILATTGQHEGGITLLSPGGIEYLLTVDDDGVLGTEPKS
jgi:hypothetical protein